MQIKQFVDLSIGDTFVFGSKVYTKKVGVSKGIDFNAEESKSGDYWQFDDTDSVFLITTKEKEPVNV